MVNLSLLFAPLALLAGLQAPVEPSPAAALPAPPITVHLMTILDYPDMLGGQRVRLPVVAVKRVVGPRLVVVRDARIIGIVTTYLPWVPYDKLLVLLPAAATLSPGQVVTFTGVVRTVAAARAVGLPVDDPAMNAKSNSWIYNRAPVLVADSVETVDGVSLVSNPGR